MSEIFDRPPDNIKFRIRKFFKKQTEYVDLEWTYKSLNGFKQRQLQITLGPDNSFEICLEYWVPKHKDWSVLYTDIFDGHNIETREQCWKWLETGERPFLRNIWETIENKQ